METISIKNRYKSAVPELKKKFGYKNDLAVPKILKVVINSGIGKFYKESEKIEDLISALKQITGQAPVKTKAKKAISGFKIRIGLEIGLKVTLRGNRMWDFIDRLVHASLPRIRDFQGIEQTAIDQNGNLNLGLKEHIVFPEISPEAVKQVYGFQITIVTNAKNKEQGMELFKEIGFPIK